MRCLIPEYSEQEVHQHATLVAACKKMCFAVIYLEIIEVFVAVLSDVRHCTSSWNSRHLTVQQRFPHNENAWSAWPPNKFVA
jgi:hypothetical protein